MPRSATGDGRDILDRVDFRHSSKLNIKDTRMSWSATGDGRDIMDRVDTTIRVDRISGIMWIIMDPMDSY